MATYIMALDAGTTSNRTMDRTFYPSISPEERAKRLKGWEKAVSYAHGWARIDS